MKGIWSEPSVPGCTDLIVVPLQPLDNSASCHAACPPLFMDKFLLGSFYGLLNSSEYKPGDSGWGPRVGVTRVPAVSSSLSL